MWREACIIGYTLRMTRPGSTGFLAGLVVGSSMSPQIIIHFQGHDVMMHVAE